MPTFVSRPQTVEAIQWTGENIHEVGDFLECELRVHVNSDSSLSDLQILAGQDGAQGWVPVPAGHWIVRRPDDLNHHWPVDPDYFASKYERPETIKAD